MFTLNTSKLVIDWNSSGRLFHSFWPLKVNARWPTAVLQSGTCRRSLFLVLQLCTSDLALNFWQRYGGASPLKHVNTMVASLTASCLIIGSHCNCLRIGVTWSNFLVPETIRAAKFCTACNSSMFFLVVLAHTDKQYNNLLNTRELIIVTMQRVLKMFGNAMDCLTKYNYSAVGIKSTVIRYAAVVCSLLSSSPEFNPRVRFKPLKNVYLTVLLKSYCGEKKIYY